MHNKLFTHILFFCTVFIFFTPAQALAQLSIPNFNPNLLSGAADTLELTASPRFPDPYEEYTVTLSAPSSKYNNAIIDWTLDGELIPNAKNKRSFSFEAGKLGDSHVIQAAITTSDGFQQVEEITISVVQVDMIIEADTIVPAFYAGRAVPSKSSDMRVIAIPHIPNMDAENLSYQWTLNSEVLEFGSIRGLQSVSFETPTNRENFLKVSISDGNTLLAEKILTIETVKPEVLFYEDNPLRGVLPNTFARRDNVLGNQIVVRAEPYNLSRKMYSEEYQVQWSINGQPVNNSGSSEPNVITLRGGGTNSTAEINFRAVDIASYTQNVSGSFRLEFAN